MNRLAVIPLLLLPFSAAAQTQAQTQTETITVTAAREAAIAKFIETRAAATRMTGKIARWKMPVCPVVYGIPANYAAFITTRLRETATAIGAPVNPDADCRANIQIVFTTAPQALLDNIRAEHANVLGYTDNSRQVAAMTQLKRPVHAFYSTQTADLRGNIQTDTRKTTGITIQMPGVGLPSKPDEVSALQSGSQMVTLTMPGASAMSVTGTRFLGDGLSSEFGHVVLVVDVEKIATQEMGALSDHIALQALSQPEAFDTCQDLPSISNLLIDPACPAATLTAELSAYDRAYLVGLYKSQAQGAGRVQIDQIRFEMKQAQQ